MRANERDFKLLRFVYIFNCLTTLQIATLFSMNIKVCQRKLRQLTKMELLQNLKIPSTRPGKSPYLFYLDQAASLFNVLPTKPRINWQLNHQLRNVDIMIKIILTFRNKEINCEVLSEHIIRQSGKLNLIPDGAFMLQKQGRKALFILENDSGTEILKSTSYPDLESKLIRYEELYKENNIALFENHFNTQFTRFRLLFICNNNQRLSALSELVEKYDPYGYIWLTTLSEFKRYGITGNIFQVIAKNQYNQSIIY